jgi:phage shock protein E
MMIKKSWIVIGVILLLMAGCSTSEYKKITAKQGLEMLQSDSSIILLDVRTVAENKEIRIPGSTLIPLDVLSSQVVSLITDKDTKIIIYCRSGNRSKEAADILISLGYKNVFDMGGIIDWPYETESE